MDIKLVDAGIETDRFGRTTQLSVLVVDGRPAAILHSIDRSNNYNDEGIHQEHVIQGLETQRSTGKWSADTLTDYSCPTRSRERIVLKDGEPEPTVEDMIRRTHEDYEDERGFSFVKWGEKGTPVPTDETDAFYRGVERAKKKYSRIIRNGKLTGNARTY